MQSTEQATYAYQRRPGPVQILPLVDHQTLRSADRAELVVRIGQVELSRAEGRSAVDTISTRRSGRRCRPKARMRASPKRGVRTQVTCSDLISGLTRAGNTRTRDDQVQEARAAAARRGRGTTWISGVVDSTDDTTLGGNTPTRRCATARCWVVNANVVSDRLDVAAAAATVTVNHKNSSLELLCIGIATGASNASVGAMLERPDCRVGPAIFRISSRAFAAARRLGETRCVRPASPSKCRAMRSWRSMISALVSRTG